MDKFKAIKKASITGLLANIFLLIIKALIGFTTNSYSMIADAINSAGDIVSSLMTYIGNKIASIPRDDDHDLGHGKAEYIYSLLISIIIMYMSYKVFYSSLLSIINGNNYQFSYYLIVVCIITIITKLFLYIYTNKISKKYNNLLIKANANDHKNDMLLTLLNLFAIILSSKKIYFFDGLIGIFISIWILISGIKIFKASYDVLMDKSLNTETKEKVYEIIKKHKSIKKIQHFNSTPVGYQYQISFTIFVDGNLSTFKSHEIANKLEKEIDSKLPEIYLTVIHVNPIEVKDN